MIQWCKTMMISFSLFKQLALNVAVTVFTSRWLGERLYGSEEDLLQHRTDGSDAFDTLYIGCEKFPQADTAYVAVDVNGIV